MRLSAGYAASASARPGTAGAPISRCSPPMRRRSSCACSTARAAANSSASRCRSAPKTSGTAICNDVSPGPALRLSRARPLRAGARPPLQPQQAAARSLCQAARRAAGLERCAFRLSHRQRARGPVVRPPRQRARHAEGRRGRRDLHLGPPRDPPQHPLGRHHHLRGARQGADADSARTCRRTCAAPIGGLAVARDDRPSASGSASPRSSCCRSMASSTTASRREEAVELLGLQHASPSSRRSRATRRTMRCDAFRTTVARLHDAGIEVILDVVYNHTAEGNHLGPTLSLPRHRQRLLLLAAAGQPALLRRLHRLRQLAQSHPSARAADGDGFAALLGRGLPCRRLPLRSRHHAGARAERLRSQQLVPRPPSGRIRCWRPSSSSPSPGTSASAAIRSARFPRWSEWNDRYRRRDAALLERRRQPDRRVSAPHDRLRRPVPP